MRDDNCWNIFVYLFGRLLPLLGQPPSSFLNITANYFIKRTSNIRNNNIYALFAVILELIYFIKHLYQLIFTELKYHLDWSFLTSINWNNNASKIFAKITDGHLTWFLESSWTNFWKILPTSVSGIKKSTTKFLKMIELACRCGAWWVPNLTLGNFIVRTSRIPRLRCNWKKKCFKSCENM